MQKKPIQSPKKFLTIDANLNLSSSHSTSNINSNYTTSLQDYISTPASASASVLASASASTSTSISASKFFHNCIPSQIITTATNKKSRRVQRENYKLQNMKLQNKNYIYNTLPSTQQNIASIKQCITMRLINYCKGNFGFLPSRNQKT